jgi:hypothetical protein
VNAIWGLDRILAKHRQRQGGDGHHNRNHNPRGETRLFHRKQILARSPIVLLSNFDICTDRTSMSISFLTNQLPARFDFNCEPQRNGFQGKMAAVEG